MFNQHESFNSPAEEIAWLKQEAQKEYILQTKDYKDLESANQSVVEGYAKASAQDFLNQSQILPDHELERITLRLKPEAHDKQMEELFALMMNKGIKNTLDLVAKMKNPHLEDDFHRFLVQYLHTIGSLPGLREKSRLDNELRHVLFVVTLPTITDKDGQDFKIFIQAMKQFYVGMLATVQKAEEYYTLELAVSNKGRDIAIYASVPNIHTQTFERLVHSYYPQAIIDEVVDDYNIFSSQGSAIASTIASLQQAAILPLKTEEGFEHDPLSALIGSMSQLQSDGEGAAFQIIIANNFEVNNKLLTSLIDNASKGENTVEKLYQEATASIGESLGRGFMSLFEKEKKPEAEKKIDTTGIQLANLKNKTQILSINMRLISTAPTLNRASSILSTLKASFQQFALPNSNSLVWNDIKANNLTDFIRDFTFRALRRDQSLSLNIDELATIFHFPVGILAAPELKESSATGAPAPVFNTGGIVLGTNTYRGQKTKIVFAKEDRMRHCYVIGQTGTGKTVFLKNMIIQDIKNGDGVCFIDPHGNDIEDILANIPPERIDDVIYFDPAYTARPMGLNMLEYDPRFPEQKIFVINELMSIFNKLFDMKATGGPMFEQYFRNSAGLVMSDPESGSTLLEISRVLSDKAFRDLKLSRCTDPIIKQFWLNAEKTTGESALANFVPYITNKFDIFISNEIMRPVVAQQKSVLNFREIMDNKKILLVNLSKGRLGDINSNLIGLLLVGKITMAALSRVDILGKQAVNDFYLYIDEFQNVTTDSISTILSEARKYRLALTVAHQYVEQLDENIRNAVFGNVGTMAIHRVSPENADIFERQLSPVFTAADIIKQENLNCYIKMLVGGIPAKPFNSHTPFPPVGNKELAEKIKELSYLKFGRPRAEIEAEIFARFGN